MTKLKHKAFSFKDNIGMKNGKTVLYIKDPIIKLEKVNGFTTSICTLPKIIELDSVYRCDSNNEVVCIYYKSVDNCLNQAVYIRSNLEVVELIGRTKTKVNNTIDSIKKLMLRDKLCHGFYIGADPEIFVENKEGEVIPAFNFLKHKNDINVDKDRSYGQSLYWDGFQAEFTVAAGTCLQGRVASMIASLNLLNKKAKEFNPEARLSLKTVMNIPEHYLMSSKDEHVALGCMPSLNVYNLKGEEHTDGRKLLTRSTGGHIHFGVGKLEQKKVDEMVKALDAIIGVMCVSLFAKYDDPTRRRSYGLAGEYRLPKHGVEYRTLSNAWLAHPFITHIVFDVARKAAMLGLNGYRDRYKGTEQEIIDCINNGDVKKAQELMNTNSFLIKEVLRAAYNGASDKHIDMLFNIFYNGMETAIKNPEDIEGNWCLVDVNKYKYNEKEFRSGIVVLEERKLA